jgi:magnesium-transporting ATPase (P-type)
MRLIEAHNLRVEEAILTGESTVVDKHTNPLSGELPLGDRTNMVFSGTTVSAGGGVGVVTATGQDTELGHINQMMAGSRSTVRRCWCRWTSWVRRSLRLFWR